ncbi:alpha-ketoglutarate-dependent dioxygenase AlkB [Undibacterium cyanobacteriorum]|uniref:Alpha-ketoglutarate-dependent dioxygenase AlkB n=1 Tax=Undibacterium cyanobacteriorum TaxID=3073561 RepID=A0ABY9RK54_9BURK|nr:alpha-ketoglutarate-dependent dioxygenase AlkB [Undibacterium sp. 20NA77.5]WMW81593.1 alpha-ketoglutarate-dependent dioxygenase AlkB [Undibacterium sp. 20NA77.5]
MFQNNLFTTEPEESDPSSLQIEHFEIPDAELDYYPHFFAPDDADQLFKQLHEQLAWQQHHIRIAGIVRAQPRLSVWYGDPEAHYSYSGLSLTPLAWHPLLAQLRTRLESHLQVKFNSVLANLYRNQIDSMGWHADDEPELGPLPVIASLSFGTSREFLIRHNTIKTARHKIELGHGSLLVMAGTMQQHWQHAIAKKTKEMGPRINLTFRFIQHGSRKS